MNKTEEIANIYLELQQQMCLQLELCDGTGKFTKVPWSKEIGYGVTGVLKNGSIIEKAGLNFSHVKGKFSDRMESILKTNAERYEATGISSIVHPNNPHIPIIHMNVRFFELDNGTCWFGGGIDLTPHYIDIEEAKWFHKQLANVCDSYNIKFYPKFKEWADDYFYIEHRNETRGIGGIFFDMVQPQSESELKNLKNFTIDLAKLYPDIYCNIMDNKRNLAYTEQEKKWQHIRRGRYTEFNLVYDRGTKFGLESGGNTESILISLPPMAEWEHNFAVLPNSNEEKTQHLLKKGIEWINI